MSFDPTKVGREPKPIAWEKSADHMKADNEAAIRQQARQALADNRAYIAAVKPSTAAAQANAAYDATVRLSRQNNGIIRLLLSALDGAD